MKIEKLDPVEYKSVITITFGVPPYRRLINLTKTSLQYYSDDFIKKTVFKGGRLDDITYVGKAEVLKPGLERGYLVDINFLMRNKVLKYKEKSNNKNEWYRIDKDVIKSIFDYYDKSLERHLADKYKRLCCDTVLDTMFERTWGKDEDSIKDVFKDMFAEL